MTYDPMKEVAEEGSLQEEAAQIISQLIAWHDGRVETLKQTSNVKVIRLQGGKGQTIEIDDPKVIQGYQLGVEAALQLLGKLPISISE
ncbi:MAG: hypothetical protein ACRBB6_02950 [Neptuniibacter sp.]